MRDLFVTLVVLGSIPFILKRPFIGILMWTWLGYMNPHKLSWGFAMNFPFAQLVALATLMGLLFSKEAKKIPWTKETVVLLFFIIWMCITTAFAFNPAIAGVQLDKVLKIQLMTFISLMLLTEPKRIHQLVWVVALSLGFYGIKGGIFTILTGGGYHVYGPLGTFIGGNNEMGLALLMTIPLMRYLQLEATQGWLKLGLTGAIIFSLVAVVGTQSRGALVGLVVMGAFFVWKSPRKALFFLLMGLAIPLILGFMPESWWERMGSIQNYEADASAMGRIIAWKFAYNVALENFMGGGFNALVISGMRDVHSIYFEVMSEHGFFGLLLYLLLLAFTWLSAGWVLKRSKKHEELRWARNLAPMLQVSGIAYCACGAFLGLAYFDLIYLLVVITVATRKLVTDQLAELESTNKAVSAVAKGATLLAPSPPGRGLG